MTRTGLALILLAALAARPSSQTVPRLDRLDQWLTAIERHQPGTLDAPALEVGRWEADDLRWLWVDLNSVITLIRDPNMRQFFTTDAGGKKTQYFYSGSDVARLRELALGEAPPLSLKSARVNRLLKRGAVLHGDVAMFAQASPRAAQPRDPSTTLRFKDGRQVGIDDVARHWGIARNLVGAVVPDPSKDEMVRRWYQATAARLQDTFQLDVGHYERALRLFPSDSDLLFFAGSQHETMARPEIQSLERILRGNLNVIVRSERSELRQAETLFRRALAGAPGLVEARIRLGRVLGLQGRHAEAADQLRPVARPADPLLAYFAAMFLGAEVEALGQPAEARTWYERAAALNPGAPSPLLALSQLAQRTSDRSEAIRALEVSFQLPEADIDRDDPWWTYHMAQGRDAADRLIAMYRLVPPAEAR